MIVDDVGEVISGQRIGRFVEHLVVERRGIDLHMAANQIIHFDQPVLRHFKADDPLVTAFDAGFHFFGRQRERRGEFFAYGVVVGECFASGFGLFAQCIEFFGRIERIVSPSGIDQLQCIFEIDFAAFALSVDRKSVV